MLRLWRARTIPNLLDMLAGHLTWSRVCRPCSTTASHSTMDSVSLHELDYDVLTREVPPAGSALFRESEYFSPVVRPDPLLRWDWISRSLTVRSQTPKVNITDLERISQQVTKLNKELACLEESRKAIRTKLESEQRTVEQTREEARHLRGKQKEIKTTLKRLKLQFEKEVLCFPNFVHEAYLPGSRSPLEKSLNRGSSRNLIRWPTVADDCHVTLVGDFLTGQLARLEQALLVWTHRFWLTLPDASARTYPLALSDFARGPALEGTGWPSMDKAIRLEPTRSDLFAVMQKASSGERNQSSLSSSSQWLVNPHTSNYLVGSASLASFSAYLLRHMIANPDALPIRLLSRGSVYTTNKSGYNGTDKSPTFIENSIVMTPFKQRKQVSLLELLSTWSECESAFECVTEQLGQFWTRFQPVWKMQVVHTPATQLWPCEMARSEIELVTTEDDCSSIKLASVSLLGDWISRRIGLKNPKLPASSGSRGHNRYTHMVYARLIDTQSTFAGFQQTGVLEDPPH